MSATRFLLPCFLLVGACGGGGGETDPTPLPNTLLIEGSDMGVKFQNIRVSRGTSAVTGATVTVNGVTMPETGPGYYQGQLQNFLPPGAAVLLEVRAGSLVATGQTTIPQEVTMVTPVTGATITRGNVINVTWTSSGNPDRFQIGLEYQVNAGSTSQSVTVDGSLRAGSIPTTAVPANATNPSVYVFGYANGTFSGAADPASRMNLRQPSLSVPLSFAP